MTLTVYPSRTKLALLLLGSVAFVAAGLWITFSEAGAGFPAWMRALVTWTSVPFFGACGLYIAYRLVLRRPAFQIDATGVTDHASAVGVGHLPFEEISHVVPYEFAGRPMLGIVPKDLEVLLARQNWFLRRIIRMNVSMGAAAANIPGGILPMTVVELAAQLHHGWGVSVAARLQ